MGLFDVFKQGTQAAADAAAQARAFQQQQMEAMQQGMAGVQGYMGPAANPAAFGGPSNAPIPTDDPMLAPVEGVSLADYARVVKEAQRRGATDQAAVNAVAAEMGFDPSVFERAANEWIARFGKSMVVGQQFRSFLDQA